MNHYSPTGDPADRHPHAPDSDVLAHGTTKIIRQVDCEECIEILRSMGEYPRDMITGEWTPEHVNPNKAVK